MSNVNWLNSDGLYVKFGVLEGAVGHAGEYNHLGPVVPMELSIPDLTKLTSSRVVQDYNTFLPIGAFVESVTIEVIVGTTGSGATLTVGLTKLTDLATSVGTLVVAAPQTSMTTAGQRIIINGTTNSSLAGTLIGTVLTFDGVFDAEYVTAAFTLGQVEIRVEYSIPTT